MSSQPERTITDKNTKALQGMSRSSWPPQLPPQSWLSLSWSSNYVLRALKYCFEFKLVLASVCRVVQEGDLPIYLLDANPDEPI